MSNETPAVPMPVRVAVVGCGAVGSLYAAHLARVPGVEVWAIDPYAAHVEAINANGLQVTGLVEFTASVNARTDAADVPTCDFGIVATKAMHTCAAIEGAKTVLADATVVSIQNGLGNEEDIAQVLPKVARGSIVPAGTVTAPGVVRCEALGDSWFGPFEPRPADLADVEKLAELLTQGGLPTHAMKDARGPQWTKVIFNSAINTITALTNLTVGPAASNPGLRALIDGLIDEAQAVVDAEGITLTRSPKVAIDEAIEGAWGHITSMQQDLRLHRLTEIDALNGAIANAGRRHGIATPLHDSIVALVHGVEESWSAEPAPGH